MQVSFSRVSVVVALLVACSFCTTGCRSGAWGWPATGNWLSWSKWGKSDDDATALASKPSTTIPKPSSTATPQPTTSIAAQVGAGGATTTATVGGGTAVAANASYPTTPQGYN